MSYADISPSDDVIDSRDIIAMIDELESEQYDAMQAGINFDLDAPDFDPESLAQLRSLRDVATQAEGYVPDWRYGATLIQDSHFIAYAQEYAEDIGATPSTVVWPYTHIDWEGAAEALRADYTSIEFDGVTYWVR